MIHHLVSSRGLRKVSQLGVAAGLVAGLSACASGSDYPSFSLPVSNTDAGRVSVRFPAVNVPPIRPDLSQPASPPAELDAALAGINARAEAANAAFASGLAPAQQLARVASMSDVESDTWSTAQLRVADLTSHHSAAHVALADLDMLTAAAELRANSKADLDALAQVKEALAQKVSQQARLLADINAQLDPRGVK